MGAKLDIRRAGGLTMVELIVVVAIIAIMAAVAIPSFARMGLLWRNDLQASARELYTLLRAAKIYSATYNVETAVVYTTYRPEGSTSNNLRAAAVMYGYDSPAGFVFAPVSRRDEGAFRFLPGETGLLGVPDGSERIKVPKELGDEDGRLPAHVFEPSGRLRTNSKERYTVSVGYTEDASPDERYVDPAIGDANQDNIRTIDINLYRATGRVEISSD